MLSLVKPRNFIPIHGEYRMLVQHGLLAEDVGREPGQHLRAREWAGGRVRRNAGAPRRQRAAGAVLVDGMAAIDGVDGVVLRDRRALAADGVVMVALTVEQATGRPISGPDLVGAASSPVRTIRSGSRRAIYLAEALAQPLGEEHTAEDGLPEGQDPRHAVPLLLPAHETPADDPAGGDGGLRPE